MRFEWLMMVLVLDAIFSYRRYCDLQDFKWLGVIGVKILEIMCPFHWSSWCPKKQNEPIGKKK
jgi:hypothetical protein